MNAKITKAELVYTGGNIWVGFGLLDNGNSFMIELDYMGVRIMNEDVFEYAEEVWDSEWQESHLVQDLEDESVNAIDFIWHYFQFLVDNHIDEDYAWRFWDGLEKDYPNQIFELKHKVRQSNYLI